MSIATKNPIIRVESYKDQEHLVHVNMSQTNFLFTITPSRKRYNSSSNSSQTISSLAKFIKKTYQYLSQIDML